MADQDGSCGAGDIVVGADDSAGSGAAVEWAAELAARWEVPLRLVHVETASEPPEWLTELAGQHSGRPEVREPVDGSDPSEEVGAALVAAAEGARLLVIGSRGGRAGLLAGEVADGIASRAPCPVAVVREPADDGPGSSAGRGPVVVGVAGAGDEAAVRFGADLAAAWHAPLRLVHAWTDVVTHAGQRMHRSTEDRDVLHDRARAAVAAARAAAEDRAPGVPVDAEVVEGTALRALLDDGRDARALVVGPYGLVPPEGMQLGSSSRALVGFAPCTVVVVRGAADGT